VEAGAPRRAGADGTRAERAPSAPDGGVPLEHLDEPHIAPRHLRAAVEGLSHDRVERAAGPCGRRRETSPERVPDEAIRIEAGASGRTLDESATALSHSARSLTRPRWSTPRKSGPVVITAAASHASSARTAQSFGSRAYGTPFDCPWPSWSFFER
jgi:hypothetical protein